MQKFAKIFYWWKYHHSWMSSINPLAALVMCTLYVKIISWQPIFSPNWHRSKIRFAEKLSLKWLIQRRTKNYLMAKRTILGQHSAMVIWCILYCLFTILVFGRSNVPAHLVNDDALYLLFFQVVNFWFQVTEFCFQVTEFWFRVIEFRFRFI